MDCVKKYLGFVFYFFFNLTAIFLARAFLMICNLDNNTENTVDDCCRRLSLISMILRCGNFSSKLYCYECVCLKFVQYKGFGLEMPVYFMTHTMNNFPGIF